MYSPVIFYIVCDIILFWHNLITISPKNIISKFESENKPLNYITSLILLVGKFYSLDKFLLKFYNLNG